MTTNSGRTPVGQSKEGPKPPSTAGEATLLDVAKLKRALMEALFLRQSWLSKSSTKLNKN